LKRLDPRADLETDWKTLRAFEEEEWRGNMRILFR
jgi:hypothetical protein